VPLGCLVGANVGVRTWNLEGIGGCERLYKALRMWVCERGCANVGVRTWGCVRGGANVGVRTWGCVRLYKALRMYDRANLHSSSVHHIYIYIDRYIERLRPMTRLGPTLDYTNALYIYKVPSSSARCRAC